MEIHITLLVLNVFTCAITDFRISSESINEYQLKYFSTFCNCLVYKINFNGYDINLTAVSQPVILLRYNSFAGEDQLYSIEYLKKYYNLADQMKSRNSKRSFKNWTC